MSNFHLDIAVQYVRTVVDKNRCATCDQLSSPCVRYPCGHSVCKRCVELAEDCLLCLSPPVVSTHVVDEPLSRRTKHITNLLRTFQDLFNINVYRQYRLSEQLKLEKQVFPTCIQAPSKYCNKRRSLNVSAQDKENVRPFLPGENISYSIEMENSIENVQQWLNRNERSLKESNDLPRKPFSDLNVNDQNFNVHRSVALSKNKYNKKGHKKRTHNKIINHSREKIQLLKKGLKNQPQFCTNLINSKNDFNESGIVISDESIVIDETQNGKIDKDKQAWLAVLQADKDEPYNIEIDQAQARLNLNSLSKFETPIKVHNMVLSNKVQFIKKGSLKEICHLCQKEEITGKYNNCRKIVNNDSKNIKVIIDNNNYTTTIKISDCEETGTKVLNNQSMEIIKKINCDSKVKGDIIVPCHDYGKDIKVNATSRKDIAQANVLKDNAVIFDNIKKSKLEENVKSHNQSVKGIVIEESEIDSDSENGTGNTLEVTAEVHRTESFDDYGILSTLELEQYQHRKRIPVRSRTPQSSDSSDKENYDPNRAKRQKTGKKSCKK